MYSDETKDLIDKRRAWVDHRRTAQPDSRRRRRMFPARAPRSRSRMLAAHGETWSDRARASRALHRLGELTARAIAGVVVAIAVTAWAVVGLVTGFPPWWETVLYSTGASVTLVMVFAIQHTQTRQETAIQRKLDELLRAMPHADNRLIAAEDALDEELDALADLNLADRAAHGPSTDGPRPS